MSSTDPLLSVVVLNPGVSQFGKVYQMKYLAGLLAGDALAAPRGSLMRMPRNSTCVAYIAPFPIPEVQRHINAFTLGCRERFPACMVKVAFTGDWHDAELEHALAEFFWREEGCDLLTQGSDTAEPMRVYDAHGGFGIGYNHDMRELVGESVLTSPLIHWGAIYSPFVRMKLDDAWVADTAAWPGVAEGAVSLAPSFSPLVEPATVQRVQHARERLARATGDAAFRHIFCGPLRKRWVYSFASGSSGARAVGCGSQPIWTRLETPQQVNLNHYRTAEDEQLPAGRTTPLPTDCLWGMHFAGQALLQGAYPVWNDANDTFDEDYVFSDYLVEGVELVEPRTTAWGTVHSENTHDCSSLGDRFYTATPVAIPPSPPPPSPPLPPPDEESTFPVVAVVVPVASVIVLALLAVVLIRRLLTKRLKSLQEELGRFKASMVGVVAVDEDFDPRFDAPRWYYERRQCAQPESISKLLDYISTGNLVPNMRVTLCGCAPTDDVAQHEGRSGTLLLMEGGLWTVHLDSPSCQVRVRAVHLVQEGFGKCSHALTVHLEEVWEAHKAGKSPAPVRWQETGSDGKERAYDFDLRKMSQRNVQTGRERKLLRVETKASAPPDVRIDLDTKSSKTRARGLTQGRGSSSRAARSGSDGSSTAKPADLKGEDALVLRAGQLVKISRRRDDGWCFGSVVYDEGGPSPITEIGVSSQTGWFPVSYTSMPSAEQLVKLQTALGGGSTAANALEPPKYWIPVEDAFVCKQFVLSPASEEYQRVVNAFVRTLSANQVKRNQVVDVQRIQNIAMWQNYAMKRQTVLTRESKGLTAPSPRTSPPQQDASRYERVWLFHGSPPDLLPKIMQQGFNRAFTGLTSGRAAFGKGVYFARCASYSSSPEYSRPDENGIQHMFMCRVVVGEYCLGERNALTPSVRDVASNQLYDSTVDQLSHPSIFVTYHDSQAYPEYLVRFKLT